MNTAEIIQFHEDVYCHLIKHGIRFKPRVHPSGRLNDGYWFIGNDTYMNLSFWDGYDQNRKIHRIGFAIDFRGEQEVYLNISAKDNKEEADYLNKVSEAVGASKRTPDYSRKTYGSQIKNSKDFIRLLDQFIDEDKQIIDRYIKNSPTISSISLKKFNRNIDRINYIRSQLGLKQSPITPLITPKRKTRGRGGTTNKNVKKHIREILASQIEVTTQHNVLQNKLYDQLEERSNNDKLVMEENWIDILQECNGKTYLYEVKPYTNPTRCIREGLGQLLHYCSQYYRETSNVVLVIAGPCSLKDDDKEYFEFVKNNSLIELDYISVS